MFKPHWPSQGLYGFCFFEATIHEPRVGLSRARYRRARGPSGVRDECRRSGKRREELLLGRSVITGNSTGVVNNPSPNTFYTYGNNQINGNTTDGYSSLNTTFITH